MNEINNLKDLDHPNVLQMYEFFADDNHYYIVTELCSGGELFDEIINRGTFSERDAALLMSKLLACVNYCHQNNIVHRDLKPENILLEQDQGYDEFKLIDFGTSTRIDGYDTKMSEIFGSPYYIAPEVLGKNYGPKCDVWSCGVIAYIMIGGKPPFNGNNDKEIMKAVKKGNYDFSAPEWESISEICQEFISMLLTLNPENRPTAGQAMEHAWIKEALNESKTKVDGVLATNALNNLRGFQAENKLKQATFAFIAS